MRVKTVEVGIKDFREMGYKFAEEILFENIEILGEVLDLMNFYSLEEAVENVLRNSKEIREFLEGVIQCFKDRIEELEMKYRI